LIRHTFDAGNGYGILGFPIAHIMPNALQVLSLENLPAAG
jgi:hypothetical protein